MKKIVISLFILLLTVSVFAQTTDDVTLSIETPTNAKRLYLATDYTLDSAATKYSQEFIITNNDGGYAAEHPWTIQYDLTNVAGTKFSLYWLTNSSHPDSANGWAVIDTLVSGSSTVTPQVVLTSTHGRAGLWNKFKFVNDTTAAFVINEFSAYQGNTDK